MNEILLDNLIPFTLYNVTIFTVLHENERKMFLHTLETGTVQIKQKLYVLTNSLFLDEISPEELPYKVQLRPLDSAVRISWEAVNCSQKYGRLVYSLIVSNKKLNFTTNFSLQTDTSYEIGGLKPYTQYTLTILIARNGRNIHHNRYTKTFTFNFTTSAGGW